MLGTVNSGRKKNFVDDGAGWQSTVTVPPVNGTSGDDNATITGETSRTVTTASSRAMDSVTTGSTNLSDQKKSLDGPTGGTRMDVEDHLESLNVAFTDSTVTADEFKRF
jgi:hypothetical protein